MRLLSFDTGSGTDIVAPSGIPVGGLKPGEAGGHLLQLGVSLLIILTAFLAVVVAMYSGIQWMTSGGDVERVTAAKKKLTFAIVGLVIALGAFVLVSAISNILLGNQASNVFKFN